MLSNELNAALMRLRVIEDALNGHHYWIFRVGDVEVVATPLTLENGVRFMGDFPASTRGSRIDLIRNGDVVASEDVIPEDRDFTYQWDFTLSTPIFV